MSRPLGYVCRDTGDRPGCLDVPDERYTMRFDDIGEEPIYWCAFCGPEAQTMNAALQAACAEGPERRDEIAAAVDAAHERLKERLQ